MLRALNVTPRMHTQATFEAYEQALAQFEEQFVGGACSSPKHAVDNIRF